MSNVQAGHSREWRVEKIDAGPERHEATLAGPGARFVLRTEKEAAELAGILNAQAEALVEARERARRCDCGKGSLAHMAMLPCANLPSGEECFSCRLTRANRERNGFCICEDDDDFPSGPAPYCPVHGNTYKYVMEEQVRLARVAQERHDAIERAEAAEARVARLEEALRAISLATGSGDESAAIARAALE